MDKKRTKSESKCSMDFIYPLILLGALKTQKEFWPIKRH
jgi:hypothetical protein